MKQGGQIWITRSLPGALATAARLEAQGRAVLVAPVLEIEPVPAVLDLGGIAAAALSSANAVRRLAELSEDRDLPIFAVGDATASAAAALGFRRVTSAAGDVAALQAAIIAAKPCGEVAPICGEAVAGDLVGGLLAAGVSARRCVVYRSRPCAVLPPPVETALKARTLRAALIHSPAAGRAAYSMLTRWGPGARAVEIFGLSRACVAGFEGADFVRVACASRPTEASLLALLGAV